MKSKPLPVVLFIFAASQLSWKTYGQNWITDKNDDYRLLYTPVDKKNKDNYRLLIENGLTSVKSFFNSTFEKSFDVFIHLNRHSLDSTWKKDWNMPDFKSECWMVASGTATKLDMISPVRWDTEACEHSYRNTTKTQQLVAHELVHVFHGQRNVSPDFSNVEGLDWFIEGLATYASGQCDSSRLSEVKKAINDGKIPGELDKFWTGKLRYGLSGSVVMFIDSKYGRAKLIELLRLHKKADILSALNATESELLAGWRAYILSQ